MNYKKNTARPIWNKAIQKNSLFVHFWRAKHGNWVSVRSARAFARLLLLCIAYLWALFDFFPWTNYLIAFLPTHASESMCAETCLSWLILVAAYIVGTDVCLLGSTHEACRSIIFLFRSILAWMSDVTVTGRFLSSVCHYFCLSFPVFMLGCFLNYICILFY